MPGVFCIQPSYVVKCPAGAQTNAVCTERKTMCSVLPICRSNLWSFADLMQGAVRSFLFDEPQDLSHYCELKRQAIETHAQLRLAPATPERIPPVLIRRYEGAREMNTRKENMFGQYGRIWDADQPQRCAYAQQTSNAAGRPRRVSSRTHVCNTGPCSALFN